MGERGSGKERGGKAGRTGRRGRAVGVVLVFGLIGSIVSLLVAWGSSVLAYGDRTNRDAALNTPPQSVRSLAEAVTTNRGAQAYAIERTRSFLVDRYELRVFESREARSKPPVASVPGAGHPRTLASIFESVFGVESRIGFGAEHWNSHAFGLPMRCVTMELTGPSAAEILAAGGVMTPGTRSIRASGGGMFELGNLTILLPMRVAPIGLAINAAIYGAAAWLVWLFVRWTLKGRHIGPGCCPACGYDRSGVLAELCPECGTSKPAKPAAATPVAAEV